MRTVLAACICVLFTAAFGNGLAAAEAKRPAPKLTVDVPQEWSSRQFQTANGLEAIELIRNYDPTSPVAQVLITRLPVPVDADFVAKAFRDEAGSAERTYGFVVSQDSTPAGSRIEWQARQGGRYSYQVTNVLAFKPAPGRPRETISVNARWLVAMDRDIRPVIEAIIASARVK